MRARCARWTPHRILGTGRSAISFETSLVLAILLALHSISHAVPRVHFEQSQYIASNHDEPLELRILIDGDDRTSRDEALTAGLFSYGVLVEFDATKAEVMSSALVPAELDFFGFADDALQQLAPGAIGIKGNIDQRSDPSGAYGGSLLATVSLANLALPSDRYEVSLSLFRTLGPTEQIFLDGNGQVLDQTIAFESSVVSIEGGIEGDADGDGQLTIQDIDLICQQLMSGGRDPKFDFTGDGQITFSDLEYWVEEIKKTYIGDANLDGEFSTGDFVEVFKTGEYEDKISGNSTWADGDWNCDGDFNSGDFVAAFRSGGFELGPRKSEAAVVVPEMSSACLVLIGLAVLACRNRRHAV